MLSISHRSHGYPSRLLQLRNNQTPYSPAVILLVVSKTFYIETFGCQMNAHDSEKVIGTLEQQGYARGQDEADAGLILYNTCSIRDKAEQKVFHRLNEYKLTGRRQEVRRARLRRPAGGRKDLRGAPYVSLVAGSASYRNLPEMLARLEAGENRITGLDDRQTDRPSRPSSPPARIPTAATSPSLKGCDKFCAYCVVPYTRGKERSRTSASVLVEARKMVDLGYTEIQFLGQNVNSYRDPSGRLSFAELLVAVGELPGIRRVRFTTSHPRDFTRDIVEAIDATPTLCDHVHLPVQSGSRAVLRAMSREYTREWYLERMSWIKAANRDISITSDMIVGFPGETDADFEETITLVGEVKYDAVFAFKFSPRPNTPAVTMTDSIPDEVKSERLRILMDRQREIQREHYGRHLGQVQECMVESYNLSRNQVVGRSSQNKTVNFTTTRLAEAHLPLGSYVQVRITQTLPNCLVGEALTASPDAAPFIPIQRVPHFVVLN